MLPKTNKELFEYIFELDVRLSEMIINAMPAEKIKNNSCRIQENNIK
jgi:hypothetical protein